MEYNTLFENNLEGILITDKDGKIIYFNKSYGTFIGQKLEDVKGRHIKDFRPGAFLPRVLENRKPVLNLVRKEFELDEYFVNIYPLIEKNQLIGAISIVTFLNNAKFIQDKLKELEEKNEELNKRMLESNGTSYSFEDITAVTSISKEAVKLAKRVASQDIDILLQAESGSGKELFAQSIHNESPRRNHPFIAINCSALPKDILEAELFGYEEGAFTGSKKGGKIGLFEAASGGTLFLDEISEMDINIQTKLLRVLEERKIRRLGGISEIDVDVRIISACNVDLLKYIEEGKFRQDLYYRISIFPMKIEPLRARKGDIPELAATFLKRIKRRIKRNIEISEMAMEVFMAYDWPGNVRELNNILEFSALMSSDDIIDLEDIPQQIIKIKNEEVYGLPLSDRVRNFEQEEINQALLIYGTDMEGKKKAAKALGISLASLYNKLNSK